MGDGDGVNGSLHSFGASVVEYAMGNVSDVSVAILDVSSGSVLIDYRLSAETASEIVSASQNIARVIVSDSVFEFDSFAFALVANQQTSADGDDTAEPTAESSVSPSLSPTERPSDEPTEISIEDYADGDANAGAASDSQNEISIGEVSLGFIVAIALCYLVVIVAYWLLQRKKNEKKDVLHELEMEQVSVLFESKKEISVARGHIEKHTVAGSEGNATNLD